MEKEHQLWQISVDSRELPTGTETGSVVSFDTSTIAVGDALKSVTEWVHASALVPEECSKEPPSQEVPQTPSSVASRPSTMLSRALRNQDTQPPSLHTASNILGTQTNLAVVMDVLKHGPLRMDAAESRLSLSLQVVQRVMTNCLLAGIFTMEGNSICIAQPWVQPLQIFVDAFGKDQNIEQMLECMRRMRSRTQQRELIYRLHRQKEGVSASQLCVDYGSTASQLKTSGILKIVDRDGTVFYQLSAQWRMWIDGLQQAFPARTDAVLPTHEREREEPKQMNDRRPKSPKVSPPRREHYWQPVDPHALSLQIEGESKIDQSLGYSVGTQTRLILTQLEIYLTCRDAQVLGSGAMLVYLRHEWSLDVFRKQNALRWDRAALKLLAMVRDDLRQAAEDGQNAMMAQAQILSNHHLEQESFDLLSANEQELTDLARRDNLDFLEPRYPSDDQRLTDRSQYVTVTMKSADRLLAPHIRRWEQEGNNNTAVEKWTDLFNDVPASEFGEGGNMPSGN